MKLIASLCALAALFTAVVNHQILRKFGAMYDTMGVELPDHAGWMLWGKGALPTAFLVASAAVVFIGLAARKNAVAVAGVVGAILLMVASATVVPSAIMFPLAKILTEGGAYVPPATPADGALPDAVDPEKVGSYPSMVGKGGGYFYDEVLEYRVRVPSGEPAAGAEEGGHYVRQFATHAEALEFSEKNSGAGKPLALVMQTEWINEPEPGKFEHRKDVRLTEWRVEWLAGGKRLPDSIEVFMRRSLGPGGHGAAED